MQAPGDGADAPDILPMGFKGSMGKIEARDIHAVP